MDIKLLIIEDNLGDAEYIKDILLASQMLKYSFTHVTKLHDAIELLHKENFDVILLDLGLPDSSGMETVSTLVTYCISTPIIVLTGNGDDEFGLHAIKNGAQDYLEKNQISVMTLSRVIKYTLERQQNVEKLLDTKNYYQSLIEGSTEGIFELNYDLEYINCNKASLQFIDKKREEIINKKMLDVFINGEIDSSYLVYKQVLETRVAQVHISDFVIKGVKHYYEKKIEPSANGVLCFARDITARVNEENKVALAHEQLKKSMLTTVDVITKTVELKDLYTASHQQKVAELSKAIAIELNFDNYQVEGIFVAGSIHDIGKISIPAEILNKPGKLSENEYQLVKLHSECGSDLFIEIGMEWKLREIVLQHHERMDGSGYPNGLKGEEILLEARIIAVADVVEAMSAHRPYRPALGVEAAIEEIIKNRGVLYDEAVVDACVKVIENKLVDL